MLQPKIHTIDLKFQGHSQAIASFLVEGEGGVILIETGPESTRANLLAGIEALGFSPASDVKAVFLTHIHLDHAGAAGWWAANGVKVYVHHRGARHLVEPGRLIASARTVYGDQFDSLWGEMIPAPAESVVSLNDGDITEVCGLQVRAIETPGHAFHHHAFAIGDCVFAGDSAGARLADSNYISVTSAPPQFDEPAYLESLEKLSSGNFGRCFLTHFGEVQGSPAEHFDSCKIAVESAVEFMRKLVGDGMSEEEIQIAYTAFQMEQAYQAQVPSESLQALQAVNNTEMCADGVRMWLEKRS